MVNVKKILMNIGVIILCLFSLYASATWLNGFALFNTVMTVIAWGSLYIGLTNKRVIHVKHEGLVDTKHELPKMKYIWIFWLFGFYNVYLWYFWALLYL